jgi:hypothetical protein
MNPAAATPHPRSGGSTSAEALIRHAQKLLCNSGIEMSASKVSRLVRDFRRRVESEDFSFGEFLVNTAKLTAEQRRRVLADPELACLLAYPDPTGEKAARNVDRERSPA